MNLAMNISVQIHWPSLILGVIIALAVFGLSVLVRWRDGNGRR